MLLALLQSYILTKCHYWDNFFNDMDKFVVRLESNGTRDPQSSNADSRPIAKNPLKKPVIKQSSKCHILPVMKMNFFHLGKSEWY